MASKWTQRDLILGALLDRAVGGADPLRPGPLAEELGLPAPSVRRELAELLEDGSVIREADGTYRWAPVSPALVEPSEPTTRGEALRPPTVSLPPEDEGEDWKDYDDEMEASDDGEADSYSDDSGSHTIAVW